MVSASSCGIAIRWWTTIWGRRPRIATVASTSSTTPRMRAAWNGGCRISSCVCSTVQGKIWTPARRLNYSSRSPVQTMSTLLGSTLEEFGCRIGSTTIAIHLGYLALHNAAVLLEWVALRARAMLGGGSSPSLAKIQGKFASTLSQELSADKRNSDEFLVYRTLNGFNPAMLCVDGNDENSYFVEVNWDQDESDNTHDISNVKLYLSLRDGTLAPTRISIAIREQSETAPGSAIGKSYNLGPQDADWESAKRVFRSAWTASGELDTHLCAGHLNVGQYAVAAFRNFEQSPLCRLLFPHLRGVININDIGKTEIFGTKGVLTTNTPLTTNAARPPSGHPGLVELVPTKSALRRAYLCKSSEYFLEGCLRPRDGVLRRQPSGDYRVLVRSRAFFRRRGQAQRILSTRAKLRVMVRPFGGGQFQGGS